MRNLIVVLLAVAGMTALALAEAPPPPPSLVGKAAPEISAKYWLNSKPMMLEALRGKIVVVEFWATWCPPCRKSIPHLLELSKKYADKGVVFVSLTNEPQEKVEPFAKEMQMTYAIGGGSGSGKDYGVQFIPTAFVVDPQGKVVWQGHPMKPEFEQTIEEQVKKLPPPAPAKP